MIKPKIKVSILTTGFEIIDINGKLVSMNFTDEMKRCIQKMIGIDVDNYKNPVMDLIYSL